MVPLVMSKKLFLEEASVAVFIASYRFFSYYQSVSVEAHPISRRQYRGAQSACQSIVNKKRHQNSRKDAVNPNGSFEEEQVVDTRYVSLVQYRR